MDARSTVVKSRSSNSGITNKVHKNKKSSSSAEFQRSVVKKRGVYVEKKTVQLGLKEPETHMKHNNLVKPPPPRVNRRTFVPSTLTTQSKATTGTQYPDTIKRDRSIRRGMEKTTNDNKVQQKKKFKSKVLNKDVGKDFKEQPVIVFKSQRDLSQTPSMFSEDSIKPQLFSIKKSELMNNDSDEMGRTLINNSLAKEIFEGKQFKKEKRVRIDEPVTLVSGIRTDDNKGLYNFFVDFLETTIGAYNDNVKENHHEPFHAASFDKISLEIGESVANKLNIRKKQSNCIECDEDISCNTSRFCCINDIRDNQYNIQLNETQKTKCKRLKAKSFSFLPKPKDKRLTSESFVVEKKKNRKQRKETLLNLFKEQLRMEDTFQEPQNLYQALKIMVQNKRRCRKRLEEITKRRESDFGFPNCMYRSRKVISIRKKMKKKIAHENLYESKKEGLNIEDRKKKIDSNCSLKVTGYNYENKSLVSNSRHKDFTITHHIIPPVSEDEFVEDSDSEFTERSTLDLLSPSVMD